MEQRWETCRDKLREIKPESEMWIDMGKYRRDEVVISRMKIKAQMSSIWAKGCMLMIVCVLSDLT